MNKELDILRVIFIMMIFLNHSAFLDGGGYLGVCLFFILGGFCMTLGYYDKVQREDFNFGKYAFKRASKFYPLHWLCLIVWIVMTLLSSMPVGSFKTFVANALLLQSWVPDQSWYFSFNGISWYLSNTVFFTLVFPLIIRQLVSKSRMRNILFIAVLIAFYAAVCLLTPVEKRHAILYINPLVRLLDFVFGIYLARCFISIRVSKSAVKSYVFYAVAIVSIALLVLELTWFKEYRQFAVIFWPLAAVLLLSSALASEGRRGREGKLIDILASLGKYTFAFYMLHQMAIQTCNSLAGKVGLTNHLVVMLITLTVTSLLSVACYKWFEKPVNNLLSR